MKRKKKIEKLSLSEDFVDQRHRLPFSSRVPNARGTLVAVSFSLPATFFFYYFYLIARNIFQCFGAASESILRFSIHLLCFFFNKFSAEAAAGNVVDAGPETLCFIIAINWWCCPLKSNCGENNLCFVSLRYMMMKMMQRKNYDSHYWPEDLNIMICVLTVKIAAAQRETISFSFLDRWRRSTACWWCSSFGVLSIISQKKIQKLHRVESEILCAWTS